MRKYYKGQPIAVMTGKIEKKFLFWRWKKDCWETFEEARALEVFKEKFLSFPHKMVVVEPDFSKFDTKYNQTFLFVTKNMMDEKERELLKRCIEKIRPENTRIVEKAEVAYIGEIIYMARR